VAARATRLIAAALAVLALVWSAPRALDQAGAPAPARRIVTIVPAITEALFAIGAGPQVVGVGSFDAFPPEVRQLPSVGALLDPNTERILSLRPDLVVVYGSQSDLQRQLERAGIGTYSYRHRGIPRVLETIAELGVATGHQAEAAQLVERLRLRLEAVRTRVSGRRRPLTLLAFERQPGSLREVYASGGVGFLHEMLEIAGGANVFADVDRESVQPSVETLLARAPEVVIEVRAAGLIDAGDSAETRAAWSILTSVPAVRDGRVHLLQGDYLVVPGPRLADATEAIARALHPEAYE
jgi:iron complex transport system substrate-binding protein